MYPANWACTNHCNCSLTVVVAPLAPLEPVGSSSAVPQAASARTPASAPPIILLIASSKGVWLSGAAPRRGEPLQSERHGVEDETEYARADHEGPGARVRGVRRRRGDAGAEAVLKTAEVLRDHRRDHRQGGRLAKTGEHEREGAGQPHQPGERPAAGGVAVHQLPMGGVDLAQPAQGVDED